jgi:hypothetical protein
MPKIKVKYRQKGIHALQGPLEEIKPEEVRTQMNKEHDAHTI